MSWKKVRVSPALGVALLALVIAASGGAYATTLSTSGTITACVHRGGGGLYLARKCARRDGRLHWNAAGPQGVTGPQGAPGRQGTPGPVGPPGPATGAAGGDLAGNYPNPQVAPGAIGASKLATLPGAAAYGTSNQTVSRNAVVVINLTAADYDTDRMFNPATSEVVINTPGTYFVEGNVYMTFTNTANQFVSCGVFKNGTAVLSATVPSDTGGGAGLTITPSGIVKLAAGDKLTLVVVNSTSADATSVVSFAATVLTPRLEAQWLGP